MTRQGMRLRITRNIALVIIGVTLLAASAVNVMTLWVLFLAVPVLATLWLVLNLLDGVAQDNPAPFARVVALVVIGVALLAAGVSSVMTLWSSSFARFMYFEDRGMTQVAEIARDIPADRGLFFFGGILALIGVAALIAAAVVARRRGRAWR